MYIKYAHKTGTSLAHMYINSHDAHLCKQLKHDNATVMMHEITNMFAQLPLLNEYA